MNKATNVLIGFIVSFLLMIAVGLTMYIGWKFGLALHSDVTRLIAYLTS